MLTKGFRAGYRDHVGDGPQWRSLERGPSWHLAFSTTALSPAMTTLPQQEQHRQAENTKCRVNGKAPPSPYCVRDYLQQCHASTSQCAPNEIVACLDSSASIRIEVSQKASTYYKYGHRHSTSNELHDDGAGYMGSCLQGPAITNGGNSAYDNEIEDRMKPCFLDWKIRDLTA